MWLDDLVSTFGNHLTNSKIQPTWDLLSLFHCTTFFLQKARVFVTLSHFHPSLLFAGRAGANFSEAPYETKPWLLAVPVEID
jgi:hypothetical protein